MLFYHAICAQMLLVFKPSDQNADLAGGWFGSILCLISAILYLFRWSLIIIYFLNSVISEPNICEEQVKASSARGGWLPVWLVL